MALSSDLFTLRKVINIAGWGMLVMLLALYGYPLTCAAGAVASEATVTVDILERGIYEAARLGRLDAPQASSGVIKALDAESLRLIENTTEIPARSGIIFGFTYVLHGKPGRGDIEHTLRIITPGLSRPKEPRPRLYRMPGASPLSTEESPGVNVIEQWQAHAPAETPTFGGFGFEHESELVPGRWILQIRSGERVMAEQAFEIYKVSNDRPDAGLSPAVAKIIDHLQSSECTNRSRALDMIKVLGAEAAPALPYLIKNLEFFSLDHQAEFDCGSAKETPAAIAVIGSSAIKPLINMLASDQWTVQEGTRKSLMLMGVAAIEPLLEAASKHRNLDTRVQAIMLLGDFAGSQKIILPRLIPLLSDHFPEIRYAVLETLIKLKNTGYYLQIADVVQKDRRSEVRAKAAEALGTVQDRSASALLIELYRSRKEDWDVRHAALAALVQLLNPQEVLSLIESGMQRQDVSARADILQAVSLKRDRGYGSFLAGYLDDPGAIVREAALTGIVAIQDTSEPLMAALTKKSDRVRIAAMLELYNRTANTRIELPSHLLNDKNSIVRIIAACILASNKDGRAYQHLLWAVNKVTQDYALLNTAAAGASVDQQSLTVMILRGLGSLGNNNALSVLGEFTRNKTAAISDAALEAVGMIRSADSVKLLLAYIYSGTDRPGARAHMAGDSLAKLGELSVVPVIENLSRPTDRRFNNATALFKDVLRRIGPIAIKPLIEALKAQPVHIKQNILECLAGFPGREAADAIAGTLYDKELRGTAERHLIHMGKVALDPLLPLIHDKDPDVRFSALYILGSLGEDRALKPLLESLRNRKLMLHAIEALGRLKNKKAVRALLPLLQDQDVNVRSAAVSSLGTIGDRAAIPAVMQLLETEKDRNVYDYIVAALGRLRAREASAVIAANLKSDIGYVRITAAEALFEIGAPETAAALLDALEDPEPRVQDHAYAALKKITGADCGIYPDAWQLWLERNRLPLQEASVTGDSGILESIWSFWVGILRKLGAWFTHIFQWLNI